MVRTFFRAICAFVTLLALLAGIPAVLGYGTWAIALQARPRQGSLAQLLTTPDNGNLFLWALVAVGWIAWLAFAVSVVVEIPAQLRGRVPRRLPALGWSQRLAGGLVGAILALLPMAGGALAATGAPAPRLAVSAPLTPDPAVAPAAATDQAAPAAAPTQTGPQAHHPHYVVRAVRPADTLWGIAERTLGSGERWREIAALNEGRVMDAQRRVFDAERPIQPGWDLLLPRDAHLAPSPAPSSSDLSPAAPSSGSPGSSTSPAAPRDSEVTVRPGDTLSAIAERELGSATAWPQLFDANRGVVAPDGVRLTDPNLIEPGMRLTIPSPDDSDSGGLQGSQPPAPVPPPPAPPVTSPSPGPSASPGAGATSGPSGGGVFTHGQSGGAGAHPTPPVQTPVQTPAPQPAPTPGHGEHQSAAQFAVAAGTSVLGAVLLGTVALRRSRRRTVTPRQSPQHRASGRAPRPPVPSRPPLEPAVAALPPIPAPPAPGPYTPTLTPQPEAGTPRVAQQSVRDLDLLGRALRSMARNVAREGRRLPPINVVRVTPSHTVELHLIAPSPPVAPFRAAHASTVWWCTPDAPGLLGPEAAAVVPSPYPALVSLGETADGATVLVDLEAIRLLHVAGEPHDVAQVLRTLALELTFTPLADRVGVHVVGVARELAAVADDRLVVHPDLERAVAALQRRDASVRSALVQAGAATPREARSRGLGGDEWAPEVVLCADHPTGDLPEALGRLLDARPRGSVAVITAAPPAGSGPVARWTLPASGHGVVPGLEMDIRLQRLDDGTYHHWLRLLGADLVPPGVTSAPSQPSWPATGSLDDGLRPPSSRFPEPGGRSPSASGRFTAPEPPSPSPRPDVARPAAGALPDPAPAGAAPQREASPEDERLLMSRFPEPVRGAAGAPHPNPPRSGAVASARPVDPGEGEGAASSRFPMPGAPLVRGGFAPQAPASGRPSQSGARVGGPAGPELERAGASALPPTDPWLLALLATPPAGAQPGEAQLRVLGPVELVGAMGPVEAAWRAGLVEVAVRRELGPAQGAYVAADAIGRLREWLGDGPGGRPVNLRCDWDDFQSLRARGLAAAGNAGDTALARALALVRGAPFAETAYPWAEPLRAGMTAAVVDVAHELTLRRLRLGDHRGAEAAAQRGLIAEPDAELLLRDLVLLYADAGDGPQLHRTVARLETTAARTGAPPEPETTALLDELRSPAIDPLSRR